MPPDHVPWDMVTSWIEFSLQHPMVPIPFAHTLQLDAAGNVTVTLRLWQWIDCEHGDDSQWLLRATDEPGTTATGHLSLALVRAYSSLETRWGINSAGWAYAAAVDEALHLDAYRAADPPAHPYAIPRCHCARAKRSG